MRQTQVRGSTNVVRSALSAEEAKAKVYERGMTLKQFAEKHRLRYRTVSEVIRGVNKGIYGEGPSRRSRARHEAGRLRRP